MATEIVKGALVKTRIFLAEDHAVTREGLRVMLERQPDMEVVGEADNGRLAVKLVREINPQVVIMDITMPELNGIEATRQILSQCPDVKVIVLSVHSGAKYVSRMLNTGVSGYLTKESAFQDICKAIRSVMEGHVFLSPLVTGTVVKGFIKLDPTEWSLEKTALTPKEQEVLQLLAESRTTKEIAVHLGVSVRTVETHRRKIINKLGIKDLAGLTRFAIREGLVSAEK